MNPLSVPQYPKPVLTLAQIEGTLHTALEEAQRHAAHEENSEQMRRLIEAGGHIAMAAVLIRTGDVKGAQEETKTTVQGGTDGN